MFTITIEKPETIYAEHDGISHFACWVMVHQDKACVGAFSATDRRSADSAHLYALFTASSLESMFKRMGRRTVKIDLSEEADNKVTSS